MLSLEHIERLMKPRGAVQSPAQTTKSQVRDSGAFLHNKGTMRRSRKGRTYKQGGGVQFIPDWDELRSRSYWKT